MPFSLSFKSFVHKFRIALCSEVDTKKWNDDVDNDDPPEPYGIDWKLLFKLSESVLRNIFLYYVVFTTPPSPPFIHPHRTTVPLVLSQVCFRWREVALNTPELWSSIYIWNNLDHGLLSLWLWRSGADAPLDLRVHAERTVEKVPEYSTGQKLVHHPFVHALPLYEESWLNKVWALLIPQINRWRHMELVLDSQSALRFLKLPVEKATKLEHLSIQLVDRDTDTELGEQILTFLLHRSRSSSFILRKFSWESAPAQRSWRILNHPLWWDLRNIHFSMGLTMSESVQFLSSCAKAEEVTLGCITDACMGDEHAAQLEAFCNEHHSQRKRNCSNGRSSAVRHQLPKLRNLSIGLEGSACDCTLILQFFTLPALRTLAFQNFRTTKKSCILVEELLLRSSTSAERNWKFEKLSIIDHYMPQDVLHTLLGISSPGMRRIPAVSFYTRCNVRLEDLEMALEIADDAAWAQGVEYDGDACGGTWVGRGESSFTYLLP